MKLYLAVCMDRHQDPHVRVFDAPEKAIQYAKDFVCDNASHPEFVPEDEREANIPEWLYNYHYSCQGDYVFVVETSLNNEEET